MDNPANYSGPYQGAPNNKKLQQTQAQVDEHGGTTNFPPYRTSKMKEEFTDFQVVGIMKINIEKVLERDQKLNELAEHADTLQMGASQFEQHAARLKRKFWWQNLKMMIIIGVVCTSLIIIFLIWMFSSGDSSSGDKVTETSSAVPQHSV